MGMPQPDSTLGRVNNEAYKSVMDATNTGVGDLQSVINAWKQRDHELRRDAESRGWQSMEKQKDRDAADTINQRDNQTRIETNAATNAANIQINQEKLLAQANMPWIFYNRITGNKLLKKGKNSVTGENDVVPGLLSKNIELNDGLGIDPKEFLSWYYKGDHDNTSDELIK